MYQGNAPWMNDEGPGYSSSDDPVGYNASPDVGYSSDSNDMYNGDDANDMYNSGSEHDDEHDEKESSEFDEMIESEEKESGISKDENKNDGVIQPTTPNPMQEQGYAKGTPDNFFMNNELMEKKSHDENNDPGKASEDKKSEKDSIDAMIDEAIKNASKQ